MNQKWEYKIIYCSAELWTSSGLPKDLNQRFDEYGAEGWELVGTESIERPSFFPWGGAKTVTVVGFFKRIRNQVLLHTSAASAEQDSADAAGA